MVTLRRFNFMRDIRGIMRLEQETFGADAFPIFEFMYLQQRGSETFFVAEIENKLLAYLSAYVDDHTAYIASIAVDENFRRRGIAQKMMHHLVELLRAKSRVTQICLHVRESNEGAIRFYKVLGFVASAVEKDYYPDEDALVMVLSL